MHPPFETVRQARAFLADRLTGLKHQRALRQRQPSDDTAALQQISQKVPPTNSEACIPGSSSVAPVAPGSPAACSSGAVGEASSLIAVPEQEVIGPEHTFYTHTHGVAAMLQVLQQRKLGDEFFSPLKVEFERCIQESAKCAGTFPSNSPC